jgi:hypothetical protein
MGVVVAITASFNATVLATSQGAQNNSNPKENQTKTLIKREDGHTLTQKWLKVTDKSKTAFYHFNEIKDTDKDLYQNTPKEERHYHSNTTEVVNVDGKEQKSKRVVVYNINKNKTICNIVEHSKTGVTKDGDCSNETNEPKPTPVVPNTDKDCDKVKEDPKEEPKEEVVEQPKVVVKETTKTPVQVASTEEPQSVDQPTPESLPVTGANPINATLVALIAAFVTFIGYTSSLAFIQNRINNKY